MSVANRIVYLRERCGLTQQELSGKLRINRSVLNRIEKGTRPVRDDEIKAIADYFNVSADYLLGRNVNNSTSLSDEQKELLKSFDSLKTDAKSTILTMLDSLKVTHSAAV